MLPNPFILKGSPTPSAATKSELAASPLPSQGPKRGQFSFITPDIRGVPQLLKVGNKSTGGPQSGGVAT